MRRLPIVEALVLVALCVLPIYAEAGLLNAINGLFAKETHAEEVVQPQNAQTVSLLRAATHVDPNPSKGGGDVIVDSDGALISANGPAVSQDSVSASNGEISIYIVREGDSLSQIAEMFGVSANTILWANDIKRADIIQPEDTLIILPISGVRHVVKSGDTLKAIAEKYHGDVDDIIAYNQLADASAISAGMTIVIPGGEVAPPPAPAGSSRAVASTPSYAPSASASSGYYSHPLPGAIRTQGIHGYNGVDLGAAAGTAIRAAAAGDIIISRSGGWNGGYGNYVVIKHDNGTQTLYAHNSSNAVSVGQSVVAGQVIGYVGSTGRSTGAHLHFEVRGARNPF